MKLTTDTVSKVLSVLGAMMNSATVTGKGNKLDFYADRVRQATTKSDLVSTLNRFGELLGSAALQGDELKNLLLAGKASDAKAVYQWLRDLPRIPVGIAKEKWADQPALIEAVCEVYEAQEVAIGALKPRPKFDINMTATVLQALSHGADTKAGNATLFRRAKVRGGMELPFFSANAIGGVMRDLLADHFTVAMGFKVDRADPVWDTWFFHLLYSGGIMQDGYIPKEFERALTGAAAGTVRSDGVRQLRSMLPFFSVLGGVGKHPIEGYVFMNDLRPKCIEWGNGGEKSVNSMMDWRYLTRPDNYEGRTSRAQKESGDTVSSETQNTSMLANTECLQEGEVLEGGFFLSSHMTDIERAALYKGLTLLKEYGYLGAKGHRGYGLCAIDYQSDFVIDPKPYDDYLSANKDKIIGYLKSIGAFPREGGQLALASLPNAKSEKRKQIFTSDNAADVTDDVERIIRVLKARGTNFSAEEARDRWEDISRNSHAAGWLALPSSDDALFEYFWRY